MRTATWNNVGTNVEKSRNIGEVLKRANLDYEVTKEKIYTQLGDTKIVVPNQVATVRNDTKEVLGIVGNTYEVCQNSDAFDFVNYINDDMEYVKAGQTRGGLVYIISKLPSVRIIDDDFTPYVIFQNGHNGGISIKAAICPLRIVCQNQFNVAFKEAGNSISIRHSLSMSDKLEDAKKLLKSASEYMNVLSKKADILVNNKVSDTTFNKVIERVFPIKEDMSERQVKSILSRREELIAAYGNEDNLNYKGTAWGICNAYTDYITHNEGSRKSENWDENKFVYVTFNNKPVTEFVRLLESIA